MIARATSVVLAIGLAASCAAPPPPRPAPDTASAQRVPRWRQIIAERDARERTKRLRRDLDAFRAAPDVSVISDLELRETFSCRGDMRVLLERVTISAPNVGVHARDNCELWIFESSIRGGDAAVLSSSDRPVQVIDSQLIGGARSLSANARILLHGSRDTRTDAQVEY